MAELRREGSAISGFRLRQPDGSWRWMRVFTSVLERQVDGGVEIVGYMLDITAQRASADQAAAAARLAALGEMSAGLAHEMSQPLQTILLAAQNSEVALRKGDLAAVEARLKRIIDAVMRAAALGENLRRFALGLPEGSKPEPVPLDKAVDAMLALTDHLLRQAGVEVEVALGKPAPVVLAHFIGIEQVLTNLVMNACDAMTQNPPGAARRIRITSLTEANGKRASLMVADTGGGIAPGVLARLFQPFVTTKETDKGTGLGLAISYGLVQSMGGCIEARNEGAGALFTLSLPVAPEAVQNLDVPPPVNHGIGDRDHRACHLDRREAEAT
jgi:C4-dicarboxylate-specific signal transduction histidine kinase